MALLTPGPALARFLQPSVLRDGQHLAEATDVSTQAGAGDAASGPILPIPDDLWQPAPGAVPATGDYIYLESDPGDYVGGGGTYLYTRLNAVLSISASGGHLSVSVRGDDSCDGDIATMSTLTDLEPGYYPGVDRYPGDPATGGMDWRFNYRGSPTLTGWFAIDSVTYTGGALSAITLRFEQHYEGETAALHGAIHWEADDTTEPPGPVLPIPDSLWQPTAGTVPATGDYVYLQSDLGDYIGAGGTYLYTPATVSIGASANGGHFSIYVGNLGGDQWEGNFLTMSPLTGVEPGYYPGLARYPFNNPAKGGLDWEGLGHGSETVTGWFAVDGVSYDGGNLAAITLRFEQHSDGAAPALHGALHWERLTTALSLFTPYACGYRRGALSGALENASGQPLADRVVTISRWDGGWTTVATETTDNDGAYIIAIAPSTATTYRAVYTGDATYARATATLTVLPKASLSTPTAPKQARTTTPFTCSCYLKPHHAGGSYPIAFLCQRYVTGRWVTTKIVRARAADYHGYSRCSARVRLPVKGGWRIRAVHAADSRNAATRSGWRALRVK